MQYCSLRRWTFTTRHMDSWASFLLWLSLSIPSGAISLLFPVAYWIPTDLVGGRFIFHCHIFLHFHTVHGVLKARMLKWFAVRFSSGPSFVRTLHHDPSILGGSTCHGQSFIELNKAVIHMISWVSFFLIVISLVSFC